MEKLENSIDFDKKLPQNIEMEKAVLSAIMIDRSALAEVSDFISEESFYLPAHKSIYAACIKLDENNTPIELATIASQIDKDGKLPVCGGIHYLLELSNTVASSANCQFHAEIIAQKYMRRRQIIIGNEAIRRAYDSTQDVFETNEWIENEILNFDVGGTSHPEDGVDIFDECIAKIKHTKENPIYSNLVGIDTGIKPLNELIGGLQKTHLIILAGRTGMGKTAMANSLMLNSNANTVFFSIEMPSQQDMVRLISNVSRVDHNSLKTGNITDTDLIKLNNCRGKMTKLIIDDSTNITLSAIKRKAKQINKKKPVELIVIDYLQYIQSTPGKKGTREQEVAAISRGLKSLAKELDIPILALAQLSRDSGKEEPQLKDLRESAAIEMDADSVIFLHRPEYFDENAVDENGESLKGIAYGIVAKNRHGSTGKFKMNFEGQYMRFSDIGSNNQENYTKASDYRSIRSQDDFDSNFLGD